MRFRPKGGSIAAFKSCFAYVRRTYAGALPAELKVHIDFEEVTLRRALHNLTGAPDSFGIHCCSVRRTGAMGHSNHSLNGPEGRIQVLYQLGKFCEARALSTPSKPNKVTSGMLRKRLHVFSNHSRSSPRLISTGQLHTLLHFHLRPIYVIVYDVPYSMKDERSYLRESFTLRCFQRLSRPHLATLLCRWHDNRCTRGASIPVLSY